MIRDRRHRVYLPTILLFAVLATAESVSAALPNLIPYRPSGWSEEIVVSKVTGDHINSSSLTVADNLYIDWAALNDSTVTINTTFYTELYVDNVLKATFNTSPPLAGGSYTSFSDYPIGSLSAGTHTFRIKIDSSNVIEESRGTDNEYTKTITVAALPNLIPYRPSGWSEEIVVSRVTGDHTDSSSLTSADILYIDWAALNDSTVTINNTFYTELYVDNVLKATFNTSPPLSAGSYTSFSDHSIGKLSVGTHTIRIKIDSSNVIEESRGTDNEYTKTISVGAAPLPNLTPYQPSGWSDKLVVSSATGTIVDSSSLTTNDTVYVDGAVLNDSNVSITTTFYTELYVDEVLKATFNTPPPLYGGAYASFQDYSIGTLTAGTHSIRINTDSTNVIDESRGTDNEYTRTITVIEAALPNLVPYKPSGWSDILVVSKSSGNHTDSSSLTASDTLYVDGAVLNDSAATINRVFYTELYVDNVLRVTFNTPPPVVGGAYVSFQDYVIGSLATGTHSIRIKTDSTNEIEETRGTDNEYTKTITVGQSAMSPNLAPYTPSGWDSSIIASRTTGSHSDSPTLRTSDNVYVDWAVINKGSKPTDSRFYTQLYVDGTLRTTWSTEASLGTSSYDSRSDYSIGTLGAGQHTILLKTDSTGAIAESNENDNQATKTITIVNSQEPPVTGLTVTGRILSRATGLGLQNCSVSLAGKNAITATNGAFSLENIDLTTGSNLVVSLAGYLSQSQSVSAASSARSVNIPDITLTPLSSGQPAVEWIRPDIAGPFLPGWGITFNCKARINWNGNTPGNVRFYVNGSPSFTASGVGPEYSETLSIDTLFAPSLLSGRNRVAVVATSASGVSSAQVPIDISVIPVPGSLTAFLIDPANIGRDGNKLSLKLKWPEPAVTRTVSLPVLGTFGADVQVEGKFEYSLSNGSYKFEIGSDAAGIRRGARVLLGNKELGVDIGATGEGIASVSQGVRLDTLSLSAGLSYQDEFTLGRWGVIDLLGPGLTNALANIPGLSSALKPISIDLNLKPDLSGLAYFDLIPKVRFNRFELEGKLGLEADYEPSIWGMKTKLYVGGEPSVAFQIPGDLFRQVGFKAYAGIQVTFWSLQQSFEYVFVDYNYPVDPATGRLALGRASVNNGSVLEAARNQAGWHPVDRSYRDAGPERFFLTPTWTAGGVTVDRSVDACLEKFRRLGNTLPLGAIHRPVIATGVVKPNVVDNDPGVPAQAILPLLANVLPYSEPALASHAGELMLLYVRDTGAPNPVQFSEIAFTHFDGSNWSVPTAVASDPRGQFAPQVVFDGTGDAVAVWEQMKDATFSGTDLPATAAQMEIVTSRWNHITQTWTTAITLTNNVVLDHAPRLAGPLTGGDLLLTWVQNDANQSIGSGPVGSSTNSRVLTTRWNSSTQTWGAVSMLVATLTNELSDSLAAAGDKGVYLWSRDGDGNLDDLTDAELYYRVYNTSTGLWGTETRYTNDALADKNAKVLLNATGGVYALWQRGSDLVIDSNFSGAPTVVRLDSATMGFADFAATLGPGGNLLVIWQEMNDKGSDAHYRVFDPASSTWSLDTLLSDDGALERSFAPVWDTMGNLVLAYNNVAIVRQTKIVPIAGGGTVSVPGVPQPGQVDLYAARRALVKDLAFAANGLTATGTTFLPGDTVTLKAKVRNTGNVAVQNIQVAFYDGDPTVGGTLIQLMTISGWLKSSDEQEASVVWAIPSPATPHTVFAVIDPAAQVTEFNEANNSSALALNGADLEIEYLTGSVLRDGSIRVVVRVRNEGAPASGATTLKLWPKVVPGTNPLALVDIGSLSPGDSLEIPVDLPAGAQGEGEMAYRLTIDEENLIGDIDRTNNTLFFSLNLFVDDDGDGLPRAWELANGLSDSDASDADGDLDGDSFTNAQEYLAGTNPRDANSFFRPSTLNVIAETDGSANTVNISWASVSGRLYRIERSFDLLQWDSIADNIESTPPLNTLSDRMSPPRARAFYRLIAK